MGPLRQFWQVPQVVPAVQWRSGELLAWRLWRLCRWAPDGSIRLVSAYRPTVWEGPVLTADMLPIAAADCGVGVYALKSGKRPDREHFDWAIGRDTWVRGWVALSGQVVEHEHGYRAERAVIRRLRLGVAAHRYFRSTNQLAWLRDELERRYQCPVKVDGIDARIARRFRSPVDLLTLDARGQDVSASRAPVVTRPRVTMPTGPVTPRVYGWAVRRLGEQIIRWRVLGRSVRILQRPYYAGVSHVRAVLQMDGRVLRFYFNVNEGRWRKA